MQKATVVLHGYGRERTFRKFKTVPAFQLVLGVFILLAPHGLLMADQNDMPHQTHLLHAKGPHISNCSECHTDTPGYDNVDWNACASCHSPGGAYNGVSDPALGAVNNWGNTGSSDDADESLVYETDGGLKSEKKKWCATCHDEDGTLAPNVVGDDTTWGHYVTGHRMSCAGCHDPRSAHIDGSRLPVFDYIKQNDNPTNFRFRTNDPTVPPEERLTYDLQLPYNTYLPGPEGSFALCYRCHSEAIITQDEPAELLTTNFTDYGYIAGGAPDNLHFYHVGGTGTLIPVVYHGTCVLCHDPHGQSNPAMSRREMGNFIYFDENGCEITDRGDWHNPDINVGGAQTEGSATYAPLCVVCHTLGVPPNPDCQGDNPYEGSSGMDGYYTRDYTPVAHGGEPGAGCMDCHGDQSHGTHFDADGKGPGIALDESGCLTCHDAIPDVKPGACNACHSPGGALDGVNDQDVGALFNWPAGIYESDGTTLKSGKERWCAGCHDGEPANSKADGSGIEAPDIVGDDSTFGYYVNGHGKDGLYPGCPDCHDPAVTHIDHNARTYAAVTDNYRNGYRLAQVDNSDPLNIPRENSTRYLSSDFRLCFSCHSEAAVTGLDTDPEYKDWKDGKDATMVSEIGTDFRNVSSQGTNSHPKGDRLGTMYPTNSHWNHLAPPNCFTKTQKIGCYGGTCHNFTESRYDSDFDGVLDSHASCTACHNPHGTRRASDSMAAPHMTRGDLSITHSSDNYGDFGYMNSDDYSYSAGDLYCGDCHGDEHGSGTRYKYYRTPLP